MLKSRLIEKNKENSTKNWLILIFSANLGSKLSINLVKQEVIKSNSTEN